MRFVADRETFRILDLATHRRTHVIYQWSQTWSSGHFASVCCTLKHIWFPKICLPRPSLVWCPMSQFFRARDSLRSQSGVFHRNRVFLFFVVVMRVFFRFFIFLCGSLRHLPRVLFIILGSFPVNNFIDHSHWENPIFGGWSPYPILHEAAGSCWYL